jgi:membrane-associated phospholipid phosphatase
MWGTAIQAGEFILCRGLRRSCLICFCAWIGIVFSCPAIRAQEPPPIVDANSIAQDQSSQNPTPPNQTPKISTPPAAEREVTWRSFPVNFLEDQKQIWTFPTQLAKGKHWLPTLAVAGVTTIFLVTDSHDTPYFRRTTEFNGFNKAFSGTITGAEIAAIPAAFMVVGHFRHNSYAETTALLAAEAYADTAVVDEVMKVATRRLRPSDIPPSGSFSDTFYEGRSSAAGFNSSFPSGHAIAAFSVATVFAHRYRQHRWVPFVAYGLASVIAFSRVTNQAHFPSDVFLGAALGFAISEFSVLKPH